MCAGPEGGEKNLKGAVAKVGSASESRKTLADALVFYQDCECLQATQAVPRGLSELMILAVLTSHASPNFLLKEWFHEAAMESSSEEDGSVSLDDWAGWSYRC